MGAGVTIPIDKTSFFTFSLFAVENLKLQRVLGSVSPAKCPSQGAKRPSTVLQLLFSKGVLFSVTGFVF